LSKYWTLYKTVPWEWASSPDDRGEPIAIEVWLPVTA